MPIQFTAETPQPGTKWRTPCQACLATWKKASQVEYMPDEQLDESGPPDQPLKPVKAVLLRGLCQAAQCTVMSAWSGASKTTAPRHTN